LHLHSQSLRIELEFGHLINYQSHETYRVTHPGYKMAEALTKPADTEE